MAMSRSFGCTPITDRPPIRTSPLGCLGKPGNDVEQGRLAAAGRAEQHEELAAVQRDDRCPSAFRPRHSSCGCCRFQARSWRFLRWCLRILAIVAARKVDMASEATRTPAARLAASVWPPASAARKAALKTSPAPIVSTTWTAGPHRRRACHRRRWQSPLRVPRLTTTIAPSAYGLEPARGLGRIGAVGKASSSRPR